MAKKAVKGYLAAYTSTETLLKGCKPKNMKECETYEGKIREALGKRNGEVGVPQGGAISMLIANWVLDVADRRVERWGDKNLFYARFCDDIVIVHPNREKCRAARDRYLRAGPFFAMGEMCWMSAFPDMCGAACEHQLRQLDAVRANILYPLQKMAGTKYYFGRPASYCGFLDQVARPVVGTDRHPWVARLGYEGL